MEKGELRKPISQLFDSLKERIFLHVIFVHIGCSEQLKKSYNFCDIINWELYNICRLQ